MAALAIADICDANAEHLANGDVRLVQSTFKCFGKRRAFSGPVVTVKVFEDSNVLVRELLESKGDGRVVVIDGNGSRRCALLGGILSKLAQNMGWAGIVVNGCVRDVDDINECEIGVRALETNPIKPKKTGLVKIHVPVQIAGTPVHDGDWLYADSDGILVSKFELSI